MRRSTTSSFIMTLLWIVGCTGGSVEQTTEGPVLPFGAYEIGISGPEGITVIVGDIVETNWVAEDGFIYLGTDEFENEDPIGTLTMTISRVLGCVRVDDTSEVSEGMGGDSKPCAQVLSAIASKSDKRVGTAAELNAKTYRLRIPEKSWIVDIEIGPNWIQAKQMDLKMEKVLTQGNDVPEDVTISGSFFAVDESAF